MEIEKWGCINFFSSDNYVNNSVDLEKKLSWRLARGRSGQGQKAGTIYQLPYKKGETRVGEAEKERKQTRDVVKIDMLFRGNINDEVCGGRCTLKDIN